LPIRTRSRIAIAHRLESRMSVVRRTAIASAIG
jgi:hypothetical protein